MNERLFEFISKIPKTDLHVHLDGSIRLETIIDLSKQKKFSLPSYTVEGLHELVFKDQYNSLVEYLAGFGYVTPLMQTTEDLERISYEFVWDNIQEGVCYVEVKLAPQLHMNEGLSIEQILLSVNKGLDRAKREYNQTEAVRAGKVAAFNYGIIVCTFRYFTQGLSRCFDLFLEVHQYAASNSIFAWASQEVVRAGVKVRDQHGIPIVAFDLVGAEAGNPPIHHKEAYHFAHRNFMHCTVHAGEAYGPESIFQAVTELYPDRIGHGVYLFSHDAIADPKVQDKERYIHRLVQYLAAKRIVIEVCLTSNLQTIPTIGEVKQHSFGKMLAAHLPTTICTDNRTISKTNVTQELLLALKNFNLTQDVLREIVFTGFNSSFYPGTSAEKQDYVKRAEACYDDLVKQYHDVF